MSIASTQHIRTSFTPNSWDQTAQKIPMFIGHSFKNIVGHHPDYYGQFTIAYLKNVTIAAPKGAPISPMKFILADSGNSIIGLKANFKADAQNYEIHYLFDENDLVNQVEIFEIDPKTKACLPQRTVQFSAADSDDRLTLAQVAGPPDMIKTLYPDWKVTPDSKYDSADHILFEDKDEDGDVDYFAVVYDSNASASYDVILPKDKQPKLIPPTLTLSAFNQEP